MIRAMTKQEVRDALHQAAVVCIEKQTTEWWSVDVTQKDGAYRVAQHWSDENSTAVSYAEDSDHAAAFLLFVREACE